MFVLSIHAGGFKTVFGTGNNCSISIPAASENI